MSIQQKYYFILFLNNRLKCQSTSSSQVLFPHHELVILSSNPMTEAVKKGSRNAKKFYKKRYVRGYTLPMSLSVEGKCLAMICLFLMVNYTPECLIRSIKLLKLLGNLRLGWHLETKSFPPHFSQNNQSQASEVTRLVELWFQMSQSSFQRTKSFSDSQNHHLLFSKGNVIPRFLTLSWVTESSKHSTQGTHSPPKIYTKSFLLLEFIHKTNLCLLNWDNTGPWRSI